MYNDFDIGGIAMKYNEMFAYLQYLKEMKGEKPQSLKDALNDVGLVMEFMAAYERPDDNQKYPPIDKEQYKNIEKLFDKAVNSVNNYLKENENSQDDNVMLLKNFNTEFLAKSYVEYKNVKPDPEVSLHDSMNNFRYESVKLSNADLKRVGANLSSRIQLSVDMNGQKTKGVFTPTTLFNPKKRYQDMLSEMKLKYPMYNSFWDSLDNKEFYNERINALSIMHLTDTMTMMANDKTDKKALRSLKQFEAATTIASIPTIDKEYKKYMNDPAFFGALYDFTSKAQDYTRYRNMNSITLGIKEGSNIDVRNCAMTSVANLLGVDDLIAKAKQITIKMPDGKYQTGTFMEFAEGKDVNNLDPVDVMRILPEDAFENTSLKTQIANLQVLDYISGNLDRHGGNMFYEVDPKTRKVVGIKGIDNDASFIGRNLNKKEVEGKLCSIREMHVIDEDMAKRILELDEGVLGATLHGYGLTDEEIKASWERLKDLQDAVRNAGYYDPEKGLPKFDREVDENKTLTIVRKQDWDKLSFNDLKSGGGNNYFARVEYAKNIAKNKSAFADHVTNAEAARCSLKTMLTPNNTKAMINNAKSDQPFMRTSARYKNVIAALEAYQNTPVPADILAKGDDPKWTALNNLKAAVDAYKEEKIRIGHFNRDGEMQQNFKGKALKRIHDVEAIGKFADEVINQRKLALQTKKELDKAIEQDKKSQEFNEMSIEEKNQAVENKLLEEANKQDLSASILNDINKDNVNSNEPKADIQEKEDNNIIKEEEENILEQ